MFSTHTYIHLSFHYGSGNSNDFLENCKFGTMLMYATPVDYCALCSFMSHDRCFFSMLFRNCAFAFFVSKHWWAQKCCKSFMLLRGFAAAMPLPLHPPTRPCWYGLNQLLHTRLKAFLKLQIFFKSIKSWFPNYNQALMLATLW